MKTFNTVLAWVWLHMPQISATIALLLMLLRTVPASTWVQLEKDWPRIANLARVLRAVFPDIVKAARALYSVWTGKPWPIPTLTTQTPAQQTEPNNEKQKL